MIIRACCVCQIKLGEIDDGRAEVFDSHGYCQRHFDEAMTALENEFAGMTEEVSK